MAIERTLSIVKPDAVAKNHIGSDSVASADREVNYFFAQTEIAPRTR